MHTFFGCEHTLQRDEKTFYLPILSDWHNYENWKEARAEEAAQRASTIYQIILSEYQLPELDPAISEALDAFVAKREEEGGAPV